MAEGRLLRKKIARDERVAQLSMESQLLFVYAIPFADDAGRLPGDPGAVRALCAPLLPMSDLRVEHLIIEWVMTTRGNRLDPLVIQYHVDPPCLWRDSETSLAFECRLALQFTGFERNQPLRLRRGASSSLPPPEACRVATVGHRGPPWATVGHLDSPALEDPRARAEEPGFGFKLLTVVVEEDLAAAAAGAQAREETRDSDVLTWFETECRQRFLTLTGKSSPGRLGRLRELLTSSDTDMVVGMLDRKRREGAAPRSLAYFVEALETLTAPAAAVAGVSDARRFGCPECEVGGGYHADGCSLAPAVDRGEVARAIADSLLEQIPTGKTP